MNFFFEYSNFKYINNFILLEVALTTPYKLQQMAYVQMLHLIVDYKLNWINRLVFSNHKVVFLQYVSRASLPFLNFFLMLLNLSLSVHFNRLRFRCHDRKLLLIRSKNLYLNLYTYYC